MKSIENMLSVYNKRKTFVSFLEEAQGNFENPEETTLLSVDKIISYVRDFCSKIDNIHLASHLQKLQYITVITEDCFRKGYIKKKLKKTLLEPINCAFYDLEEGNMSPIEVADILSEDILNSEYLEKYDVRKRYILRRQKTKHVKRYDSLRRY